MSVTVLGPTRSHPAKLRTEWNKWLRANQDKLKVIRDGARKDEERLGASEFERFIAAMKLQTEAFGNPESVTPPNLASLMLLVEEGGKSILLTGDAPWDQIVDGLEQTGRLAEGQTLSIDVVKVPITAPRTTSSRQR
jgi:beta-lactamase superfamily II metal-dependent hydrolase